MLRPSGSLFVADWEPHSRQSVPEYEFFVRASTSSKRIVDALRKTGAGCTVRQRRTVARAFALDEAEARRRARLFFPDAEESSLADAVARKVRLMRRALPDDVSCRRYLLRARLTSSSG